MIETRKKVGLHSESDVEVTNTSGYYESKSIGKCGELICRVGSWSGEPAGYTLASLGDGWAYYIKMYGDGCALGTPHLGTVNIRFKAPADWSTAYIWAYNENNRSHNFTGYVWSGVPMSLDSDGYYSVTLNDVATPLLGAVINNGSANTSQTVDLMTSGDVCWETSGSYRDGTRTIHYVSSNNSCTPYSDYMGEGITIRTMPSTALGDDIYIYAWDGKSNGAKTIYTDLWPGSKMANAPNGYHTYTFPAGIDNVYLIFNDRNGKQTDDIASIRTSTCFEISTSPRYNGYGQLIYDATQVNCTMSASGELRNTTGTLSVLNDYSATIYPNPVKDILYINSIEEIDKIEIETVAGIKIKEVDMQPVSVSDLLPGIYFVKINYANGNAQTAKIIKK
ncbi:MAG: starch-binding protein [Candidatus Azobacteroides sp.]|nr:starch-binding protein [Candidatus Azobacteroides sp.]